MKQIYKVIVIFVIMGGTYYFLEILYDGTSHISMFLVAGICGVFGDMINEVKPGMKIVKQSIMISVLILLLEYIAGYIVNIRMGLNIWDYSNLPMNLHGQICVSFGLIWFFVFSPIIIWFGDSIRHYFWNEEAPVSLFKTYKALFVEIADQVIGLGQET